MSQGDESQTVPPSHLLAEEQREGWGCMPAEGAVLSQELRPSGTELPFPVRSGAASQPGQGRARQSSQNKQNKAGERASQTGPKPMALQSRGKAMPRAALDTGPHPMPPPVPERPPSQKPQGGAQTWACGFQRSLQRAHTRTPASREDVLGGLATRLRAQQCRRHVLCQHRQN